jgi:phosphoketolase
MIFVIGPGHGGPAALANAWLEGSYSEAYPSVPRERRRRAADPAPERVEDREPDGAGRIPEAELDSLLRGYGYEPIYVTGHEPATVHEEMAAALDDAIARIREIQQEARSSGASGTRRSGAGQAAIWPMIVLRTPKGWTGPAVVDGLLRKCS